jgi:hypothetical protein
VFNPISGNSEANGTSIVGVTNPRHPVEIAHIPTAGGGAQMARVCDGKTGTLGTTGKYYLLRNNNGVGAGQGSHEIYDVTDPAHPQFLHTVIDHLTATHKNWWECDTGIAYIVAGASSGVNADGWNTNQHIKVYDLSDPTHPVYIRDIGLVGQNPGSSVVTATSGVHGPISIHNNPVTDEPVNRIYIPYGTSSNGVFQIVDRLKVLPNANTSAGQPMGGSWVKSGTNDVAPSDADLQALLVGSMDMTPTEGAHTSFPMFGIPLKHYQGFASSTTRDLVALISEETDNHCSGAPHFGYLVDTTRAIGAGAASPAEKHPMVISTMQVCEDSAKPDFCTRGTRFLNHSTNESFYAPYYGKLLFIANFDAGLRVWDIRDPYHPEEVAHFIPPLNANIIPTKFNGQLFYDISTDNAEVDDNGLIYIVDRVGGGADILQLNGCAKQIVDDGKVCNSEGN